MHFFMFGFSQRPFLLLFLLSLIKVTTENDQQLSSRLILLPCISFIVFCQKPETAMMQGRSLYNWTRCTVSKKQGFNNKKTNEVVNGAVIAAGPKLHSLLLSVYEKAYQWLCLKNKAQLLAHNQLFLFKSTKPDCTVYMIHRGEQSQAV